MKFVLLASFQGSKHDSKMASKRLQTFRTISCHIHCTTTIGTRSVIYDCWGLPLARCYRNSRSHQPVSHIITERVLVVVYHTPTSILKLCANMSLVSDRACLRPKRPATHAT